LLIDWIQTNYYIKIFELEKWFKFEILRKDLYEKRKTKKLTIFKPCYYFLHGHEIIRKSAAINTILNNLE